MTREQERAARNRVHLETVHLDDARPGGADRPGERGRATGDAQHRCERPAAFCTADVDANAEFVGDRTRVDDRNAPVGRRLQQSGQERVDERRRIKARDLTFQRDRERR